MNRKEKAMAFARDGYSLSLTGRNVQVTDAIKDYTFDKISKIERYSNRIMDIVITLDIQKLDHKCDMVIKIGHLLIKSTATSTDLYASIDKAVDKVKDQLLRYKNRVQDHHAKGRAIVDMNVNVFRAPREDEVLDVNAEIDDENFRRLEAAYQPHAIVKQEIQRIKTLTHHEAILKMDLSHDHFMVFRSEEDNKLKIIYRRDDGHYGIMEPEL